jgi:hypothetical protein
MIAVALALILAQFPTRQSIIDLAAQVTGRRWE